MKKIMLIVLAIMLMSFGLVYADDPNPCAETCDTQEIGQISYCGNDNCDCENFDYESQAGYCKKFSAPAGVVFKLCDCDEVGSIDANEEYYLNVIILTPGVYFNYVNPSVAATEVDVAYTSITSYADMDEVCQNLNGDVTKTSIASFRNSETNIIPNYIGNSGLVSCTLPPENERSVCFNTTPAKIFRAAKSYIVIDLPEMFYDNTLVSIGTEVKVSIELKRPNDICVSCPGFCTCVGSVGYFGCTDQICLFDLPYLLPNNIWWTGIALSNTSNQTNIIKIVFHDGKGGEAVYIKQCAPYEQQSRMLSDYLDESTGDDLSEAELLNASVSSTAKCQAVVILGDGTGYSGCYGYVGKCSIDNSGN